MRQKNDISKEGRPGDSCPIMSTQKTRELHVCVVLRLNKYRLFTDCLGKDKNTPTI